MLPAADLVVSDRGHPWWAWGCSRDLTERDLANVRSLNVWLLVVAVGFAVAVLVLSSRWAGHPAALAVVLLPILAGARMFRVAVKFLSEADELTRRIQLESMAVGFGAGFAAVILERLAREAAESPGLPAWLAELPDLFMPLTWMLLAYGVSVILLQRHYSR